jgi:hypothetical protein
MAGHHECDDDLFRLLNVIYGAAKRANYVFLSFGVFDMGLPLFIAVFLVVGMSCVAEPAKSTARQPITVEFAVSESANVMDLAGPWEVFQDAHDWKGFRLVIVSDKKGLCI